jgi:hypothetical protein
MKVILSWEYENPSDMKRHKDRYKFQEEELQPYFKKKEEEGLVKINGLSDNTRKMVTLMEFESAADFAKVWDNEEFHKVMVGFSYYVDNIKLRILRPASAQMRPA